MKTRQDYIEQLRSLVDQEFDINILFAVGKLVSISEGNAEFLKDLSEVEKADENLCTTYESVGRCILDFTERKDLGDEYKEYVIKALDLE